MSRFEKVLKGTKPRHTQCGRVLVKGRDHCQIFGLGFKGLKQLQEHHVRSLPAAQGTSPQNALHGRGLWLRDQFGVLTRNGFCLGSSGDTPSTHHTHCERVTEGSWPSAGIMIKFLAAGEDRGHFFGLRFKGLKMFRRHHAQCARLLKDETIAKFSV